MLDVPPAQGASQHLAVEVDAAELDDADLGEGTDRRQTPLAAAVDRGRALDVLDQAFEGATLGGRHLEGADDVALADRGRALRDEVENFLACRQTPKRAPCLGARVAGSLATRRLPASGALAAFCGHPLWHGRPVLSSRSSGRARTCSCPCPGCCACRSLCPQTALTRARASLRPARSRRAAWPF